MNDQKRVSIVIPVYNGEKTLPDTLRSVQNLDGDFELLVIDDASTDNTVQLAENAGAKVIRLESNQGPATARNKGAQTAKGDIILFTDSDVLLPKNLIQDLTQVFAKINPSAVQGTFSDVCPYANFYSQYKNLYNRFVLNQLPEWIDTTFTSITAVNKGAFLASGGFDENIKTASVEDRTLGRNLINHGYKIYFERRLEVIHNKKLSAWGFFKNQFCRSRDLIKLMLRNKTDHEPSPVQTDQTNNQKKRFGTNSLATMMRLPVAYIMLIFAVLAVWIPIFWTVVFFFSIIFVHLSLHFLFYIMRSKGFGFAISGLMVNYLDALISGIGVAWGVVEYLVLKKRY